MYCAILTILYFDLYKTYDLFRFVRIAFSGQDETLGRDLHKKKTNQIKPLLNDEYPTLSDL